jgi:hypothetical protein
MSPQIRLAARALGQIILAFSPLKNFPSLQQPDDHNDQGDDQKNVDQAAGVEREQPQKPRHKQDEYESPNHGNLLFFFCLSLTFAHPISDSTMDSGETTYLYAVFMPSSGRVLGVSGKIHWTQKTHLKRISSLEIGGTLGDRRFQTGAETN